jgi:limonene-1,2-epoxide hydrolase
MLRAILLALFNLECVNQFWWCGVFKVTDHEIFKLEVYGYQDCLN